VTCVRLSITQGHLAVLPRVPHLQLWHFVTSLPESLPPLYPNNRSDEIPNSSLLLIATHDFGTFETKVSTSYPSICQNAKILTPHQRGSNNENSHLFEVSDFMTSQILMLSFRFFNPQNLEIPSFDALHQYWLTQMLSPLREFTFHDLVNLEERVLTLQFMNPLNEIMRVIQWFLWTQILRSNFSRT
jgi:hypothetical protein